MDTNTNQTDSRQVDAASRAGYRVKLLVVYYCLCGIVVFILDGAVALHTGHFVVASHGSVIAVRFLAPVGLMGSLAALLTAGASSLARVGAVSLLVAFAGALVFAWVL